MAMLLLMIHGSPVMGMGTSVIQVDFIAHLL